MRKLMLDALDNAVQQHILKMFNVLIIDPTDEEAIKRFETGVGNCIKAYERVSAVICNKCEE